MHQPVSTAERSFLVVIFTAERSPFQTLVSLGAASRKRTGGDFDGIGAVGLLLRPLVLWAGHRRERRLPRGSAIARLSLEPSLLLDTLATRLAESSCQPASTLLGVTRLAFPELLIEIEATAVV